MSNNNRWPARDSSTPLRPLCLTIAGLTLMAVLAVSLGGCPPPVQPPPVAPDAALDGAAPPVDGDAWDALCIRLASLGCGEGASPKCADALRRAGPELGVVIDLPCALDATDKAGEHRCGVDCP